MLTPEYVRHHIDALLRLSRDVKDPAASAELREMADELRIVVSVADVAGLAADLKAKDIASAVSVQDPERAGVVPFRKRLPGGAPLRLRSRS